MSNLSRRAFLASAGSAAVVGLSMFNPRMRMFTGIAFDRVRFLFREKPPLISTVLVDCDGTLYRKDSSLEALKRKFGSTKGEDLHKSILTYVKNGTLSLDQALLRGFELLTHSDGGFNIHMWEEILYDFKRAGEFRQGLIDALLDLQSHGMKVVIGTRGSELSAHWIARNFGFMADRTMYFGTHCETDRAGQVTDLIELIGSEDGMIYDGSGKPVKVTTKIEKTRSVLAGSGVNFYPDLTATFTDDILDRDVIVSVGRSVLLLPTQKNERSGLQSAALQFGFYDRVCFDDPRSDPSGERLKRELLASL
ncbi:HAD family hydrolase [Candidatus Micrarchaeota archaeon]|nr:HAD family hydrolase [Candidatus Micrarchaeota archaeon]